MDTRAMSDESLLRRAEALARAERVVSAELVSCLAEIERRRLHLERGYLSLFEYCVERLKLSEGAAGRRVIAARAARRCPAVLSFLRDGRLSLGALCRVEPFLDRADAISILDRSTALRREELDRFLESLTVPASHAPTQEESLITPEVGSIEQSIGRESGPSEARPVDLPAATRWTKLSFEALLRCGPSSTAWRRFRSSD